MSTFKCEVVKFDLFKHENADALSIAQIRGWQCVVRTVDFEGETLGVYIPLDAIAPADHPLLSFLEGKKVRTIKLRKAISQGVLLPAKQVSAHLSSMGCGPITEEDLGKDFAEALGIKKYEPPTKAQRLCSSKEPSVELPSSMHKYTDIENVKNFPDLFSPSDLVNVTEKLHGTSARYGLVEGKFYVASHNLGRYAEPSFWNRVVAFFKRKTSSLKGNVWNDVAEREGIRQKLKEISLHFAGDVDIVVYGEIVGSGVQDLDYGFETPTFFPYDISIDGHYLNEDEFDSIATEVFGRKCPVIHTSIPFSSLNLKELSNGKSTLTDKHCREGVIIKASVETRHPYFGRMILKSIGEDYYLRNGATDN